MLMRPNRIRSPLFSATFSNTPSAFAHRSPHCAPGAVTSTAKKSCVFPSACRKSCNDVTHKPKLATSFQRTLLRNASEKPATHRFPHLSSKMLQFIARNNGARGQQNGHSCERTRSKPGHFYPLGIPVARPLHVSLLSSGSRRWIPTGYPAQYSAHMEALVGAVTELGAHLKCPIWCGGVLLRGLVVFVISFELFCHLTPILRPFVPAV
jgi:hypothetical protein